MPTHPPARRRPGRRLEAAALRATEAGWAVFPIRPRTKIPAVTDWEHTATTDPDQIRRWWAARPWNIGIATGPSGLLVVDLDRPTLHDSAVPPAFRS